MEDATFEIAVSKTEFGYMSVAVTLAEPASEALERAFPENGDKILKCFTDLNDYKEEDDTSDELMDLIDLDVNEAAAGEGEADSGTDQKLYSVREFMNMRDTNDVKIIRIPFTKKPLFFVKAGNSMCKAGSFLGVI